MRFVFAFLSVVGLGLSSRAFAQSNPGGNKDAKDSTKLAMGLITVGKVDLKTALLMPDIPEKPILIWKALQEMGGGGTALANNTDTDKKTSKSTSPDVNTVPVTLGTSNLPVNPAKVCSDEPDVCKCNADPKCTNPQMDMPTLDLIKRSVDFANKLEAPPGSNLANSLSNLDKAYQNAKDAADGFNKASDAGALGSGLGADTSSADLADSAAGGSKSSAGTGEASNEKIGERSGEDAAGTNLESHTWARLIELTDQSRGKLPLAVAQGMNLVDVNSGKFLTIWQRATRALRGPRNRDIVMAKTELIRKLIRLRQNKAKQVTKL